MKTSIGSDTMTITCQPRGQDETAFSEIWSSICFAIVIAAFITLFFDGIVIIHEDKVKRMKKELELLEALLKDFYQLSEEEKNVKARAHRFWDSQLNLSGIHFKPTDSEETWVDSAKKVVTRATECLRNFKRQSGGMFYGYTAIFRFVPIIDVVCQISNVRKEIKDLLDNKDKEAKDVHKSMESFRSKIRSLPDQYTIEEDKKSAPAEKRKERKSSKSIEELMKKSKDLFSDMDERWSIQLLLPLEAFLKDLDQFQLETYTENSWKEEADELIAEAERRIDNFSWWVSLFGNISILKYTIWIVKGGMNDVFAALDDLLNKKVRYGFNFINRAAEKPIFPSTHQNAYEAAITSAIKNIRNKLRKAEERSNEEHEIDSLCIDLEKMHKDLRRREETAGRDACLEQIEWFVKEVDNSLDKYLKGHIIGHVQHLKKIQNSIRRLQKITEVCHIIWQKSTLVVGLENDIRNLVKKLTNASNDYKTLSIIGMRGVGKTTMAKAIYYNKTIVQRFPMRFWVTVNQEAVVNSEVRLIKEDGSEGPSPHVAKIHDHLTEKPGLVVLDNVSEPKHWKQLERWLSRMTNGSRIVLTTSSKSVASNVGKNSPTYQLRLLTKEKSWELLQNVTPNVKSQKVEKLAKKVVGRCGGLPLAISSLGYLLAANDDAMDDQLKWALKRINQGQNQIPWQDAWENNSKDLDGTLRNCLSSFALFPIDFEIPARRLVKLWVAEGLAVFDDKKETPEEAAERYLETLRDCNMIQAVELKSNGKIKTCSLPSALRETIVQNSNRTSRSQYSSTRLVRRFANHFDDRGHDANLANVFSKNGLPLSVLFFDNREGNKPGEHIGKLLSLGITSRQFMEIKVLDLERVFRPQLPDSLRRLIHLRYLGLRWTYLEALPPFIGKLLNLETLDVKHTCIHIFPSSIFKLKKLRNLYLNQSYRSKLEGKLRGNFHENLQTLWGVFIQQSSPLLHGLHMLKNLRNLKLAFQLTNTEKETLAKLIVKLTELRSLRLRSVDEMGGPQRLILHDMSKLEKLESLHLFGNLEDRLCARRLPQSLTDLTLSASKILHDPMQELQKLSKLKSLCFYAESYTGNRMVCCKDSFPALRVLQFWMLKELEIWEVEEGAMPSLLELEFRNCSKLKVPSALDHLKNLHRVKLCDMPDEFRREIENKKQTCGEDVEIVQAASSSCRSIAFHQKKARCCCW